MSKFSSPLAERLYEHSLEGFHDAEHRTSTHWYAFFDAGYFSHTDGGVILTEDELGFVYLTEYPAGSELITAWAEVCAIPAEVD